MLQFNFLFLRIYEHVLSSMTVFFSTLQLITVLLADEKKHNHMKCPCSIVDSKVMPVEGELSKSLLENSKCYILDCGAEIFVWVGRITQVEERKVACQVAEVLAL